MPTIIRRFAATAILAVGASLATPAEAGEPIPDLVPISILGPQITNVGNDVTVHVSIANLGDELLGDYTAEVLLQKDAEPSKADIVVATLTTSTVSSHTLLASVPSDLESGTYHWTLRLVDVAGEIHVANNTLIGLATSVIAIDLSVADLSPIEVFVRPTDPVPAPIEVVVENVGSLGTILIYQTKATPEVSWLTIDPPENFAFGGGTPTPNRLYIDQAGLPAGEYQTTLRFQNVTDEDDFEEIPLTLTVGDSKFVVGDQLQGQISSEGEVDEILFDGLKGMKMKLAVKSKTGDLKPIITIFDPNGNVAFLLKFPHSNKSTKKTVKLKMSGEYRFVISGKKPSQAGDYRIKTSRKLPKKAKTYVAKVKDGESAQVLAFAGAALNITSDGGGTSFMMSLPSGQVFDATALAEFNGSTVVIEQIPLAATGLYEITVNGIGAGKAKLQLAPSQPSVGTSLIYLP